MPRQSGPLHLLRHPYLDLEEIDTSEDGLRRGAGEAGSALVWPMARRGFDSVQPLVSKRPGGMALIIILPEADDLATEPTLFQRTHACRPHSILPFHVDPSPEELALVLRRPPHDLAAEVTDYLLWRGLTIDRETIRLLRRVIELSAELRSITALSRSMYLSRRALGRRLMTRGLPVPSHWLQLGRLLRVAINLQNSDTNLFSIACQAGYPDGFSVSNQMSRLIGCRPSLVRERLGWEWIVESWLRKEAEAGGLSAPAAVREPGDEQAEDSTPLEAPAREPSREGGRPHASA